MEEKRRGDGQDRRGQRERMKENEKGSKMHDRRETGRVSFWSGEQEEDEGKEMPGLRGAGDAEAAGY